MIIGIFWKNLLVAQSAPPVVRPCSRNCETDVLTTRTAVWIPFHHCLASIRSWVSSLKHAGAQEAGFTLDWLPVTGCKQFFWGGGGGGCHFRTKHITNTWFEHFHACCRFTCIPYISTFYSLGYENKPVALFKTPQMRTRREKDEIERVKMKEVTCITDSDVEDIPNIKK